MANQLDSSEIIAILEYGDHTKVSDLKQMIAEYLVTSKGICACLVKTTINLQECHFRLFLL